MKNKRLRYLAGLILCGLFILGFTQIFPLHQQYQYNIHYSMTMQHDLSARLGKDFATQQQRLSISLDGALKRSQHEASDSSYWAVFILDPARVQIKNGESILPEHKQAQFATALSRPFRAHYHRDGRIIGINCDSSISASVESVQRNIACLFQYPDKTTGENTPMSREEADVSGIAMVQYHSDIHSGTLQKVKTAYSWLAGTFGGLDTPTLTLSDSTHYLFDNRLEMLEKLQYKTVRALFYNGVPSGKMTMDVSIGLEHHQTKLRAEHHKISDLFTKEAYYLSSAPYEPIAPIKAKHDKLRRTLNGKSAFQLLLEVQQMKAWNDSLYRQAVAALSIYPQSAGMYEATLRSTNPQSLTFQFLSNALAEEHGIKSQAALNNILLYRGKEWPVMYEMLPLLALLSEPEDSLTLNVKNLAFNSPDSLIRGTAQLALGGMALQMAKKTPKQAAILTREIIARLKQHCSETQYLLVLGNTGNQEALPEIVPFLTKEKHPIFHTALQSLRLIPGPKASMLLEHYSKHPDRAISATAKEVLQFRSATP